MVLTARMDQLASCWIHNVCEVLYCKLHDITPLLNPYQPYENVRSRLDEPISPLYAPFTELFARARECDDGTEESWRHIHEAAARVVLRYRRDVIAVYREVLSERFSGYLDCVYNNPIASGSRDAVCVHVRLGDVEHLSYSNDFERCADEVVKFFDWAEHAEDIGFLSYYLGRGSESSNLPCRPATDTWNWGQTAIASNHLRDVMQIAASDRLEIQIITHRANDLVRKIAAEFGATVLDGESEIESIARMVSCRTLYLASSYMGFVAGILKRVGSVYYPRNAMFSVFGLGSKHDVSKWRPIDLGRPLHGRVRYYDSEDDAPVKKRSRTPSCTSGGSSG